MIGEGDFQAIQALKRQGLKKKRVAEVLGLDRKTIRKYWKAGKREANEVYRTLSRLHNC